MDIKIRNKFIEIKNCTCISDWFVIFVTNNRHFSLLNVNAAGACGYDFPCDGGRLVRAYLRQRRGTI